MRTIFFYLLAAVALLPGCTDREEEAGTAVPEGKVAVYPVLPGYVGGLSGGPQAETRAGSRNTDIFAGKEAQPLPDGSTLWLHVKETGADGEGEEEYMKSYVVRNIEGSEEGRQALYPCTVEYDDEGNIIGVEETSVPLYLTAGHTYTFRAMSPAKKLVETSAGDWAVSVKNKEYLMANDDRYASTASKEVPIADGSYVEYVELNPMAHQTAQLEFTIYKSPEDKDIFLLDVTPRGVEVAGVQSYYRKEGEENGWNWNWSAVPRVYLEPKVGDNNERFLVRRTDKYADSFIDSKSDTELYIKCPILPTDAYSTSVIVLFNLSVNGVPTQFEMMLNQKVFDSAYTYHYKGELKMEEGITTINWQYVSWNEEVPIL